MKWVCTKHIDCPAMKRRRSHYTNALGQYITGLVCPDCHNLEVRETWPTGHFRIYCPGCGREA